MRIFIAVLFILLFSYQTSYADYVNWECTKKVKIVEKQEFVIFSDLTEATMQSERLKGKLVGVKDANGQLAYLVLYKVNIAESNLVEGNDCIFIK